MRLYDNEPGEKFGRLVLISKTFLGSKRRPAWLCACDCGKTKTVYQENLRSGHTKSCGCLKREFIKSLIVKVNRTNLKSEGTASYSSLYGTCRIGAKRRNISFDISMEQFKDVISKNCTYCGEPPHLFNCYARMGSEGYTEYSRKLGLSEETVRRANIFVNGVDRADNSIGYIINNCIPCCRMCNIMKWDHPKQKFIEHAEKIVNFQRAARES